MKTICAIILVAGFASAASIESVSVRQRWPWSQLVDIDYTISTVEPRSVNVEVWQGGEKLSIPDSAFSGDRFAVTGSDLHTIVFDPSKTVCSNRVMTDVTFVLTPGEPPLYLVMDLAKQRGEEGQLTWIYPYDLTNSASTLGSWTMGSSFHTGENLDERWQDTIVWTGVASSTYRKTKMVFRYIPEGTFTMGADKTEPGFHGNGIWYYPQENPVREITLTRPFLLAVMPMTGSQWSAITGGSSTSEKPKCLSWDAIRGTGKAATYPATKEIDDGTFLATLRERCGLDFDLATEAQWEYACRAGTTAAWNNGTTTVADESDAAKAVSPDENLDLLGWYHENTSGNRWTEIPGTKQPNGWGLYDMHGNTQDWVLDWHSVTYADDGGENQTVDPVGRSTAYSQFPNRIVRGGTQWSSPYDCRSASRAGKDPSNTASGTDNISVRLCLTL